MKVSMGQHAHMQRVHVDWLAIFLGNTVHILGGGEVPVRWGGVSWMHQVVGGSEVGHPWVGRGCAGM